jgi:hypothetical protein
MRPHRGRALAAPGRAPLWRRAFVVLVLAALAACSDPADEPTQLGTQAWGPFDVSVESLPSPPRAGHNEVVVQITGERSRPVYDALVQLRAGPASDWVQAIEDGHVGVYRRAVNFSAGTGNRIARTLEVQLVRGDDRTILQFPIPGGSAP